MLRAIPSKRSIRWKLFPLIGVFFATLLSVKLLHVSVLQDEHTSIRQQDLLSLRILPEQRLEVRQVCADTCESARNGVCEDGSEANEREIKVLCDLGTDCSDCGPWTTEAPEGESLPKRNIEALNKQKIELFVRETVTQPPFLMAYTDYELDNDVSGQMHHVRIVEGGLTALWKEPLERCCKVDPSRRGLVLDIGGNFGWYALYAAKMGCRVVTWEPIPHYRDFLTYGVVANNLTHLVEVRGKVVGLRSGETYEMQAPEKGNWGVASINGHNILQHERRNLDKIHVLGERIDDVIDEEVCIFKADVEGFEADVFDSAKELFKNNKVQHVFMEYTPGAWEGNNVSELFRLSDVLMNLLNTGYNIRHVPDRISKRPWGDHEALSLIEEENIKLDIQDLLDFQDNKLGCSKLSKELFQKYTEMGFCHRFPHSAHPKSFRSEYFYNTNVWATKKEDDNMTADSVVGVLKPGEALSQYFSTTGFGIGGSICNDVLPIHKLISRCPCTDDSVCSEEEKIHYAGSETSWGVAAFPTDASVVES
ncbi:hypothetical protein BSKO_12260 [Bryopsis sp. KO-2023]|nr:hypothetical protein BSKO_12260 [Bryopsis sp. KO-2023]